MEILINTLVFIVLGYASYYILTKIFAYKEGFGDDNKEPNVLGELNIGAKASKFATDISNMTALKHDAFIFGTYHNDYENVIVHLAHYVEMIMLETTLSIDLNNPLAGIEKLVKLDQAKKALNSVLTDLDRI